MLPSFPALSQLQDPVTVLCTFCMTLSFFDSAVRRYPKMGVPAKIFTKLWCRGRLQVGWWANPSKLSGGWVMGNKTWFRKMWGPLKPRWLWGGQISGHYKGTSGNYILEENLIHQILLVLKMHWCIPELSHSQQPHWKVFGTTQDIRSSPLLGEMSSIPLVIFTKDEGVTF